MKDVNNKIGTDTVGDRLYYLDWSRIILILGVFLYHATRPFAATTWHIVNADKSAFIWAAVLSVIPALIALSMTADMVPALVLPIGLLVFGALFAVNSSLHSYLIVSYADKDGVSMDVGFYYMANAMGRLIGTVLSGGVFQVYGMVACLWVSALFVTLAALLSLALPAQAAPTQAFLK